MKNKMNRTIKFRGKRVDNGEWVYGWLAPSLGNDTMCIMPESYFATRDFGESDDDDKPILQDGLALGEFFIVDPSTVGQFTGLLDKDGKEIYPNDLLRIKGLMGNDGEFKYDSIYRVNEIDHNGLSLSFVKLFNPDPDSANNSFPISGHPSTRYGSLDVDYVNEKYTSLVIPETHGSNPNYRTKWKEHHYTNDITVIGNITDNPELLK